MLKHYKKLTLLLIPACAGFCLALTLGSAEEQPEVCHLCQNKALVLRAIEAMKEQDFDVIREVFDPNYAIFERVPGGLFHDDPGRHEEWRDFGPCGYFESHVEFMIAEGDKVTVMFEWSVRDSEDLYSWQRDIRIYRVADGKIVALWRGKYHFNPGPI